MNNIPLLSIHNVTKAYRSLRPLRIASLEIAPGERVAIGGVDAGGAEVLVNLVTGAGLPDEGEVRVFGRATSEIAGGDEWLQSLERFGIVSPRAVLLEGATVEQNLALPFSLQIDSMTPETAARVAALAEECGMSSRDRIWLDRRAGEVPQEVRARLHFARAIALEPALVVMEHPTVDLPEKSRGPFGDDVARVAGGRGIAVLAITQDDRFAGRVAHRALTLQGATGVLKPLKRGWFR